MSRALNGGKGDSLFERLLIGERGPSRPKRFEYLRAQVLTHGGNHLVVLILLGGP